MREVLKLLIAPISILYMLVYLFRWTFYYFGLFRKVKIPQPVLSVGNITMGGSGKTPFLLYLLKKMTEEGIQASVVNRAYRASARRSVLLPSPDSSDFLPERYGDEACLIKRAYPQTPVVTGRSKSKAAVMASQTDPQIVLVDDGFQHWRLKRDLDVVLLDVTDENEEWALLPVGRAREPFSALGRADVLILTKTNLVPRERVEAVYQRIRRRVAPELPLVCESTHTLTGIRELSKSEVLPLESLSGKSLVLLSGVAKPEGVEELVTQAGLGPVVHHMKLRDHQSLGPADLELLLAKCKQLNCFTVLMTQKDAVKFTPPSGDIKFYETVLSFCVSRHEEQLWQKISQLYH